MAARGESHGAPAPPPMAASSPEPTESHKRTQSTRKRLSKAQPKVWTDQADGSERPTKIGKKYQVDATTGEASYKKVKSSNLANSIQLGIRTMVAEMERTAEETRRNRDLLHTDFSEVITRGFPKGGSTMTPPHRYDSFKFSSFAPYAFRKFRTEFAIQATEFMLSVCNKPLISLTNPGASGSVFFLTNDDQFIIKTVRKGEHNFMLRLLPGYYMNLVQNKQTTLPKFFGLFCYQNSLKQNIRFMIMNNLLPTRLEYGLRFDLKGSTKGRSASAKERRKKHPCYKDLDFMEMIPGGIRLDDDSYEKLRTTIERDVLVLESFRIMDYSLLVGIHRIGTDMVKPDRPDFSDTEQSADEDGPETVIAQGPAVARVAVDTDEAFQPAETGALRVRMSGCVGPFDFVNGMYCRYGESTSARPSYRHSEGVPNGNGILDGSPIFLLYDAAKVRWTLATSQVEGSGTCLGFAAGDFSTPTDAPIGSWQLATTVDGVFEQLPGATVTQFSEAEAAKLARTLQVQTRRRSMSFGTVSEQLGTRRVDDDPVNDVYEGSLRGTMKDVDGKKCTVAVYLGIIDILQSFGVRKKLEHTYKSVRFDASTVSVHKPDFYRQRFKEFMCGDTPGVHVFVSRSSLVPASSHSSLAGHTMELEKLDEEEVRRRIARGAFGNPNWTPRSSSRGNDSVGSGKSSTRSKSAMSKRDTDEETLSSSRLKDTLSGNPHFDSFTDLNASSVTEDDALQSEPDVLGTSAFGTPAHSSTPDVHPDAVPGDSPTPSGGNSVTASSVPTITVAEPTESVVDAPETVVGTEEHGSPPGDAHTAPPETQSAVADRAPAPQPSEDRPAAAVTGVDGTSPRSSPSSQPSPPVSDATSDLPQNSSPDDIAAASSPATASDATSDLPPSSSPDEATAEAPTAPVAPVPPAVATTAPAPPQTTSTPLVKQSVDVGQATDTAAAATPVNHEEPPKPADAAPRTRRRMSMEPDLPPLPPDEDDETASAEAEATPATTSEESGVETPAVDLAVAANPEAGNAVGEADTSTWSKLGDLSTNDSMLYDPNASQSTSLPFSPAPSVGPPAAVVAPRTSTASGSSGGSSPRPESPERDPELVKAAREKIKQARQSRQQPTTDDPELDEFMKLERTVQEPPAFV